jgi:YVTN family beta-propeller protein
VRNRERSAGSSRRLRRPACALALVLGVVTLFVVSGAIVAVLGHSPLRADPATAGPILPIRAPAGFAERISPPTWSAHVRPSGVEGAVVSTIDLVDNRVLPGADQPPTQGYADSIVFDPNNGDFYVRGGFGNALEVLSGTTNQVLTTIATPSEQNAYSLAPTLAVDTTTGSVYVSNGFGFNLTVIDGSTNRITGSATVGGSPDGIAFDPDNGDLYVANWGTHNVTVVDGSTNLPIHNIPVGTNPGPILYDSASKQVFVANFANGNVSVINTTTNLVVANLNTGVSPATIALDTHDDYVDVPNAANGAPSHVTVIAAATDTIRANVTVGSGPEALAYAPTQDELFIANGASDNVSILNQSTGTVVATLTVGHGATDATYDASNGDVYVANDETPNVTVIHAASNRGVASLNPYDGLVTAVAADPSNGKVFVVSEGSFGGGGPGIAQSNATVVNGSTNLPIASIPLAIYPMGLTVDPMNGNLLVQDPGGNDTFRIDPSTGLVVGTTPNGLLPRFSAYDSLNGEVYVVNPGSRNVTVLGPSLSPIASVAVGISPTGIAFDSRNGFFYVCDNYNGDLTVINGTSNLFVRTIPLKPYELLDAVLYDPHADRLYVADRSANNVSVVDPTSASLVKNITVGSGPSSLAFDSRNDTIFVANSLSGNVSVLNDTTNLVVQSAPLSAPGLLVYDSQTDVVYNAMAFAGDVNALDASTYASAGPLLSLGTGQYTSGIAYDPSNGLVYVSDEYAGSISVISSVSQYPVTFLESGLPAGTPWTITLNGTLNSSTTAAVGFGEPNGSYAFQVGVVAGYAENVTSGVVSVTGGPVTVRIGFTPATTGTHYPVTFIETGLPASTTWGVTLDAQSASSSNSTVSFSEPNGSHTFTVVAVNGYTSLPSSGTVLVLGAPLDTNITFSSGLAHLSASLVAAPATITLGAKTTFTTTVGGASPPFSFVYSGLPGNCTTLNSSILSCTPSATGLFTISVAVTDSHGGHAGASTNLTVQSPPGSGPGPSTSSLLPILAIGIAIVAALLALVFFILYRRRKPPSPPDSGPPTATAVVPPPGTGGAPP